MRKMIFCVFLSVVFGGPFCAYAEGWTPVQVSVWPPAQLFSEDKDVYGLRINFLYGRNQNVSGIDIGGYNVARADQNGAQLGFCNFSENARGVDFGLLNYTKAFAGVQIGTINFSDTDVSGVQAGVILNNSGPVRGVQALAGIVGNIASDVIGCQLNVAVPIFSFNYAESVDGVQVSAFGFNYVAGTVNGVQIAPWNIGHEVHGMQIGLFNFCDKMYGVQIGLLNSIPRQTPPFMPIFNVGF